MPYIEAINITSSSYFKGESFTVVSGSLYWTEGAAIRTCSIKDGCSGSATVLKIERDRSLSSNNMMIVTYPKDNKDERQNPCASNPCSHICVLAAQGGHKCMCPDGFIWSKDGRDDCEGSQCKIMPNSELWFPLTFTVCLLHRYWDEAAFIFKSGHSTSEPFDSQA